MTDIQPTTERTSGSDPHATGPSAASPGLDPLVPVVLMPGARAERRAGYPVTAMLSPRRVGAVYVWVAIIVVFSFIEPSLFLRGSTVRTVLNENAVSGIAALSVVPPLAAGLFDVSIGATVGFVGIIVAWLLGNTGLGVAGAVSVGLAAGACVGLFNGVLVVLLKIPSFIGTLATMGIVGALTIAVSNEQTLTNGVEPDFTRPFGLANWGGIAVPVFVMAGVMLVMGVFMDRTPPGRRTYAVGFDREVARVTGIRVRLIQIGALVVASLLAAVAGVLLTAWIGAGSPTVGPSYLLPAYAAAFLGSTQFRSGRFNAWGAVFAIILLGTGDTGMLLSGAPDWAPQVFQGVVLVAAIAGARTAIMTTL